MSPSINKDKVLNENNAVDHNGAVYLLQAIVDKDVDIEKIFEHVDEEDLVEGWNMAIKANWDQLLPEVWPIEFDGRAGLVTVGSMKFILETYIAAIGNLYSIKEKE